MKDLQCNILICGCGIIGLTIARELERQGHREIIIIEKEKEISMHASGRNSGVLHAGIYYTPDSLKAKYCLKGNRMMKEYCKEKKLPLLESGKIIVTKNESEIKTLQTLYDRAKSNGAKVELIDKKGLEEIEPNALTFQKALYSHETAIIEPKKIMKQLYLDALHSKNIKILFDTKFIKPGNNKIAATNNYKIKYNKFINCAGSYSDKIAHSFNIAKKYTLIPFKGTYKILDKKKSHMVRGNIYPVPDIKNPFLGVHFTKSISGDIYIGPTAIPAMGRENYGIFKGFELESINFLIKDMQMFLKNKSFRNIALIEPKKYIKKYLYNDAKKLLNNFHIADIMPSSKIGIRPQLIDIKNKELVMDFIVLKEDDSIHVLNAISPAFTSSMEFAKLIVDEYIN